ncbi:MAG: hypothetical protein DRJ50_09205 [Actinobacteria bacterium]|nr:MAG: hypothetical protein DRJ50_09205 [Actinomycetota bacterium]
MRATDLSPRPEDGGKRGACDEQGGARAARVVEAIEQAGQIDDGVTVLTAEMIAGPAAVLLDALHLVGELRTPMSSERRAMEVSGSGRQEVRNGVPVVTLATCGADHRLASGDGIEAPTVPSPKEARPWEPLPLYRPVRPDTQARIQ